VSELAESAGASVKLSLAKTNGAAFAAAQGSGVWCPGTEDDAEECGEQ